MFRIPKILYSRKGKWLVHGTGLGLVLIILVSAYLYRANLGSKQQVLEARMSQLREFSGNVGHLRTTCDKLKMDIQEQMKRIEPMPKEFYEVTDDTEFVVAINREAGNAGLHIENFTRGEKIEFVTHDFMAIQLQGAGTHSQICNFLDALTRLPRAIRVNHLRIDSRAIGEPYSMDAEFSIYSGFSPPAATDELVRLESGVQ